MLLYYYWAVSPVAASTIIASLEGSRHSHV